MTNFWGIMFLKMYVVDRKDYVYFTITKLTLYSLLSILIVMLALEARVIDLN